MTVNKDAQVVIAKINKAMGAGTVVLGSDIKVISTRITSGSLAIDTILGGGWPEGWVEIVGEESHGKGLPIGTPLPTPSGWVNIGDISPGDLVFGRDGVATEVSYVSPIHNIDCYKIIFADGTSITTDSEHRWVVSRMGDNGARSPESVRTTNEMYMDSIKARRGWRYVTPIASSVEYSFKDLLVEPYTMGVWLGDGNSDFAVITSADPEIRLQVERTYLTKTRKSTAPHCEQFSIWHDGFTSTITDNLDELEVRNNKHIPQEYLLASIEQRLSLLRGLMDSDGFISLANQCEYTSTNKSLALGVLELVRSLGMKARISEGRATMYGVDCGPKYRVMFYSTDWCPFLLSRKAARWTPTTVARHVAIISIEPVASVPTVCIQVANDSETYLYGHEYRVTHNTYLAMKTVAANQQKDPDFTTVWVSAEEWVPEYAEMCGVDPSRVILVETNIMEKAYQACIDFLDSKSVDLIIIDSLPALIPEREDTNDMGETTPGRGAYLTNQFFRKSGKSMKRSLTEQERPCRGIVINQWRSKIGVSHGDPRTTTGGLGKNYAFLIRLTVRRDEWVEIGPSGDKQRIGQGMKAVTIKNKTHAPQQTAHFDFYFDEGGPVPAGSIDYAKEMLAVGIALGVIERGGAWYYYPDKETGRKWNGAQALLNDVYAEPDLKEEITKDVLDVVRIERLA